MNIIDDNNFLESIIENTTNTYNKIAHTYSQCWLKNSGMENCLNKFINELPQRSNVIDIGCGVGRDVKYLIEQGINTIGIDLSVEMLNEAKKIVPLAKFYEMDMRNIEFSENSFNGIWACASVLHMPKFFISHILDEFYRILKKGGILFLSMQEGDVEEFHEPEGRFFTYYKKDELTDILIQNKFDIFDVNSKESGKNTFNKQLITKWINFFARKP